MITILTRAELLRDKLATLCDQVLAEQSKIERMIQMLNGPTPDYMHFPLPGMSDVVDQASSANRTSAVLEAFIFQAIDDRKLT